MFTRSMHLYASFYQYHFDRTFPVVPQIERCAVLLYFQSVCFHEKGTTGIVQRTRRHAPRAGRQHGTLHRLAYRTSDFQRMSVKRHRKSTLAVVQHSNRICRRADRTRTFHGKNQPSGKPTEYSWKFRMHTGHVFCCKRRTDYYQQTFEAWIINT